MQDLKAQKNFVNNLNPDKDAALMDPISVIATRVLIDTDCLVIINYTLVF